MTQPSLPFEPFQSRVEREFNQWICTDDGQYVLAAARERALRLKARGFRHYSIDAILHSIRFDRAVEAGPDHGFKINDRRSAYLSRALMREPELEGFFETRVLRGR